MGVSPVEWHGILRPMSPLLLCLSTGVFPEPGSSVGIDPILIVTALILVGIVFVILQLLRLTRLLDEQTDELAGLERLDPISDALERLAEGGDELGRRRLEHVLIDIRDGNKRFEERLLALMDQQQSAASPVQGASGAAQGEGLSERITNRLVSMGFERIDIISPVEELNGAGEEDLNVRVEARRAGVAHKGVVLVSRGALKDVRMRSSYDAFP